MAVVGREPVCNHNSLLEQTFCWNQVNWNKGFQVREQMTWNGGGGPPLFWCCLKQAQRKGSLKSPVGSLLLRSDTCYQNNTGFYLTHYSIPLGTSQQSIYSKFSAALLSLSRKAIFTAFLKNINKFKELQPCQELSEEPSLPWQVPVFPLCGWAGVLLGFTC